MTTATDTPQRTYWQEHHYSNGYTGHTELKEVSSVSRANLVASLCVDGGHAPAIDVDGTVFLEEDQLTFDVQINAENYLLIAEAMRQCRFISIQELTRIRRIKRRTPRFSDKTFLARFRVCAPTRVLPSKTKNHHHLFFDARVRFEYYLDLLYALSYPSIGIVGNNFYWLTKRSGKSMLYLHKRKVYLHKRKAS